MLRLANWNVQWARPRTSRGERVRELLEELAPDVVVMTEGHAGVLPDGGFTVAADGDWGGPPPMPGGRKVLMWSRTPWISTDTTGSPRLPQGRWVAATTESPIGAIRMCGVCIPWSHSNVTSGRRDRAAWDEHVAYCEVLADLAPHLPRPLVIAGDFNQRLPRRRQPIRAHLALTTALQDLIVATEGPHADRLLIDHVAHDRSLRCSIRDLIPTRDAVGHLSDHVGVVAELELVD